MSAKITAVHSFGLGNAFIIRYADGSGRHIGFQNTRQRAAATRLINRPGWRVSLQLGGYSLHVPPKA